MDSASDERAHETEGPAVPASWLQEAKNKALTSQDGAVTSALAESVGKAAVSHPKQSLPKSLTASTTEDREHDHEDSKAEVLADTSEAQQVQNKTQNGGKKDSKSRRKARAAPRRKSIIAVPILDDSGHRMTGGGTSAAARETRNRRASILQGGNDFTEFAELAAIQSPTEAMIPAEGVSSTATNVDGVVGGNSAGASASAFIGGIRSNRTGTVEPATLNPSRSTAASSAAATPASAGSTPALNKENVVPSESAQRRESRQPPRRSSSTSLGGAVTSSRSATTAPGTRVIRTSADGDGEEMKVHRRKTFTEKFCYDWNFKPDGRFRRCWDRLMFLLVVFSAIFEPYRAAFVPVQSTSSLAFMHNELLDIFYWIDLVLAFFTGYIANHYELVLDKKKIARHYLKGWFFVDFVTTVDWSSLAVAVRGGQRGVENRLLQMIRALRFVRLPRLIRRLTEDWTINSAYINFLEYVMYVMLMAHTLGCIYFLLAEVWASPECLASCICGFDPESAELHSKESGLKDGCAEPGCVCNGTTIYPYTWRNDYGLDGSENEPALPPATQYVMAAYWSITTMTTIGYGDITPNLKQPGEVVFVTFAEVLGMAMFALLVTQINRLIDTATMETMSHDREKSELLDWMKSNKVNKELRDRVRRFVQFRRDHKHHYFDDIVNEALDGGSKLSLLKELTPPMRNELKIELYRPHLEKLQIFKPEWLDQANKTALGLISQNSPGAEHHQLSNPPSEFFEALAATINTIAAAIGDRVVENGQYGEQLFIVLSGACRVVDDSNHQVVLDVAAGTANPIFGVTALLDESTIPTWAEVKQLNGEWYVFALDHCDLAYVSHEDFEEVLKSTWPEGSAYIRKIATMRGQIFTETALRDSEANANAAETTNLGRASQDASPLSGGLPAPAAASSVSALAAVEAPAPMASVGLSAAAQVAAVPATSALSPISAPDLPTSLQDETLPANASDSKAQSIVANSEHTTAGSESEETSTLLQTAPAKNDTIQQSRDHTSIAAAQTSNQHNQESGPADAASSTPSSGRRVFMEDRSSQSHARYRERSTTWSESSSPRGGSTASMEESNTKRAQHSDASQASPRSGDVANSPAKKKKAPRASSRWTGALKLATAAAKQAHGSSGSGDTPRVIDATAVDKFDGFLEATKSGPSAGFPTRNPSSYTVESGISEEVIKAAVAHAIGPVQQKVECLESKLDETVQMLSEVLRLLRMQHNFDERNPDLEVGNARE